MFNFKKNSMIIWRGKGWLVFAVIFLFSLLSNLITNAITGNRAFYNHNSIHFGLSLFCSAIAIFFLFKRLEKEKSRILIDKQTGEEFSFKKTHELFLIPVKYWSYITVALGLIVILKQIFIPWTSTFDNARALSNNRVINLIPVIICDRPFQICKCAIQ